MKDALCSAFCQGLTVRDVPVGLAVGTPFKQANGDAIGFYVVYDKENRSTARLEDDGLTLPSLEAAGFDLSGGPRLEALASLLRQAKVSLDADEALFHTPYTPLDRLPSLALQFVGFLIRAQELVLLTRENVEATFKDDVIRAVRSHFVGRAQVLVDKFAEEIIPNAPSDVVIVPEEGIPLAIFIGTSDTKALEALLLSSDVLAKLTKSVHVMLVVDSPRPRRIREWTMAKAMSRFPIGVFPELKADALAAMDRVVFGESATHH